MISTHFYPKAPAARAMIDSAMFYIIGTLYPYVARATYPALGFPQYPGEVGASEADAHTKEVARKAAAEAVAEPLHVLHTFYMSGKPFIGGDHPSIADIRLASTLEFLAGSTTNCRPGRSTTRTRWKKPSAPPIPNRPPTCADISPM